MTWIKLRTDIFDDPAVENMALDLGTNTHQIVGQLSDIWAWVGRHTIDGRCTNVSPALIDARLKCAGFAQSMINQGWLEVAERGVIFPKWDRHNSSSAKARALEAEAKQIRRSLSDTCRTNNGGNVRPEKRREEKSISTPQPPKGAEDSLPSSESSNSTLSSESKSEPKEKKEKGRRPKVSIHDLPADISAARRQSLATWLQHKAERGEAYKTTGFAAIMARLAPLTDSQLAACVNDSICNNWAGLFPERLTSGQPFPSGKSRNGYPPPPPDEVKIIGADTSPPGWQQAWTEIYTFPSPPHWLDVPPANQSEVIHHLRTRP